MKQFATLIFAISLVTLTSCHQSNPRPTQRDAKMSQKSTSEEAFEAFADHFSETASFAYAEVSGQKVLLVSQETFGNNENSDKEAIEASIFALDGKGKIVALGSIRSQGTLYPVSILDGKLMVAGHQFVRIYSIRGDVPELVLDRYQEGDGPEMTAMFDTFEQGNSIKFNKKLKQS